MKVRSGFVSNSSSTAFVMIVKKDAFDRIMNTLCPLDVATAEATFKEDEVFGQECMVYEYGSGHGGEGTFDDFSKDDVVSRAREIAEKTGKQIVDPEDMDEDLDMDDDEAMASYVDFYEIDEILCRSLSSDEYWSIFLDM